MFGQSRSLPPYSKCPLFWGITQNQQNTIFTFRFFEGEHPRLWLRYMHRQRARVAQMWYLGPFHCELGGGGAHCTPQLLIYSTGNPTSLCGTQVLFLKIPHFQVVEIRNLGVNGCVAFAEFRRSSARPIVFFLLLLSGRRVLRIVSFEGPLRGL